MRTRVSHWWVPSSLLVINVCDLFTTCRSFPDDSSESDSTIYAAVIYENGRLGMAYYESSAQRLHVTAMACPRHDASWVIGVFKQCIPTPSVIICPPSIPDELKKCLARPHCGMVADAPSDPLPPINVTIVKTSACESKH